MAGLLKTFNQDGDSCQLMTMNKKCTWKRFQKVGESQLRGLHKYTYILYTIYIYMYSIQNMLTNYSS
jgi:hypothetical protein